MTCVEKGVVGTMTDLGCVPNQPIALIAKFYGFGLSLVGGVSLLLMMYGGFLILSSQGSSEQIGRGKSYIFYAIGGLLLAVFGFVFTKLVTVDILHAPGFN